MDDDIKRNISQYLNVLMKELGITQEELAEVLSITRKSLQGYLKGVNTPGINVLIRIASLGKTTIDNLLQTGFPNLPKNRDNIVQFRNNSHTVIGNNNVVNGGGIQINAIRPTIRNIKPYAPQPGDITGEQANRLKDLVSKVVEIEKVVKKKPKTYGAIWRALNRKMGVTYYREIKQHQFNNAEIYLMQWIGRNKKGLKRTAADDWRKMQYKGIFAAARNDLRWTKDALDSYIYERFQKDSIRDLTDQELQLLYDAIFAKKNKVE